MADSTLIQLADAVVTYLNSSSLSQSFTSERRILPFFELTEMSDLQVSVVPATVEQTVASRTVINETLTVQIGVQKRVDPTDNLTVDPLILLVEEIGDSLRQAETLTLDTSTAHWRATRIDPVALRDHLESMRQFTSVVSLDFAVIRT